MFFPQNASPLLPIFVDIHFAKIDLLGIECVSFLRHSCNSGFTVARGQHFAVRLWSQNFESLCPRGKNYATPTKIAPHHGTISIVTRPLSKKQSTPAPTRLPLTSHDPFQHALCLRVHRQGVYCACASARYHEKIFYFWHHRAAPVNDSSKDQQQVW